MNAQYVDIREMKMLSICQQKRDYVDPFHIHISYLIPTYQFTDYIIIISS